jgi:hypothetical protein
VAIFSGVNGERGVGCGRTFVHARLTMDLVSMGDSGSARPLDWNCGRVSSTHLHAEAAAARDRLDPGCGPCC